MVTQRAGQGSASSIHVKEEQHQGEAPCEYRRRAREHTIFGGAMGALSVAGLAAFGTVMCPLCVVAAPAFLGSAAWNARKARQKKGDDPGYDGNLRPGDRVEF
ncbi:hypothetical protein FRC91_12980 [Bradymonadales bacterium TMQ1]|uniref:Uncharacterized protein n=1 Tax=Lujinxingia sediminis TaxID=2480984 RepID=A0ABY0CUL4_9DELT|nr:hypothetical protein [Lujinxingia sediminis]RVU45860.1 hypothetical protein EA187_08870 [Lujinxingia sediminis]TXC75003.1 hypothetical protein FRC91_12980 [Bradymonadales bacterium TMQ1]